MYTLHKNIYAKLGSVEKVSQRRMAVVAMPSRHVRTAQKSERVVSSVGAQEVKLRHKLNCRPWILRKTSRISRPAQTEPDLEVQSYDTRLTILNEITEDFRRHNAGYLRRSSVQHKT